MLKQLINYILVSDCRLLNDYCSNITYIVHVNGDMSAILLTSEGETILTCVNNEWKEETSNITGNISNVLKLDR